MYACTYAVNSFFFFFGLIFFAPPSCGWPRFPVSVAGSIIEACQTERRGGFVPIDEMNRAWGFPPKEHKANRVVSSAGSSRHGGLDL